MTGFGDFDKWTAEMTTFTPTGDERRYLDSLSRVSVGLWRIDDYFSASRSAGVAPSIEYAKALQSYVQALPETEQLEELYSNITALNEVSEDIRGMRVGIAVEDGSLSGDVGGYTILEDIPVIALRLYELNYGFELKHGIDKRTGRRLASAHHVPVLAVKSLAIIAKTPR